MTCCVVYIPPKSSDVQYMSMFNILEKLCVTYKYLVIFGDLNMYSTSIEIQHYYEFFLTCCDLRERNFIHNCNGRQLDVVLTSPKYGDSDVSVEEETNALVPVDVYHPPLRVSVCLPRPASSRRRRVIADAPPSSRPRVLPSDTHSQPLGWNFNKCDFLNLYHALAVADWTELYRSSSYEESIQIFYSVINSIIDSCTPKKKT